MSKPTLTVCLITYNQEEYIEKALDTILSQELKVPWELVIADDCSTDNTRKILQAYKKKHPKLIKLILQKSNVGPERNWLDLISYPKSKYVAYTEGDDYYTDTTKLQRQIEYLEAHKNASLCFHPVKVVYEDKSHPETIFPTPEQRLGKHTFGVKEMLQSNFIQTNSVMYRWRFIDENVKDVFPKGIAPGDWFLHLLHMQSGNIGFIDRAMSVYRRHAAGIWWQSDNDIDEIWKRYGVQHYGLYIEMLKIYGNTAEYEDIINQHIAHLLEAFMGVDQKHNTRLLHTVLTKFPETSETYMINLKAKADNMNTTINDQKEEIATLRSKLEQKNQTLRSIQLSRVWRLRNGIAKYIGKKPI